MYQVGDVLSIQYRGFKHYGIYAGDGVVIHNSKQFKRVEEISLDSFCDNRPIKLSKIRSSNPADAVATARKYLGLPYNLFADNCEHFVRTACGLVKESTQVKKYLVAAIGTGTWLRSNNPLLKAAGGAAVIATLLTPSEKSPLKLAALSACVATGVTYILSKTQQKKSDNPNQA